MKKLIPRFFLFPVFFVLIICNQLFAQGMSAKQALGLIQKNSSFLDLSSDDVDNSIISDVYFDRLSNLQLIYLQQTYKGIPVYNSIQTIALKKDKAVSVEGKRIAKIEGKIDTGKVNPTVPASEAVSAAARELKIKGPVSVAVLRTDNRNQNIEFSSPISRENITSKLMWVPVSGDKVSLAWQVKILPQNSNAYWLVRINANDQTVLGKDNLTISCNWKPAMKEAKPSVAARNLFTINNNSSARELKNQIIQSSEYKVIPFPAESMDFPGGSPVVLNNPWLSAGASNPAISLGWHNDGNTDYNYTRGNNVWAKEDHAGTNSNTGAAAVSTTAAPYLTFDFDFDPLSTPDIGTNQNFAITQLFYWNNVMHDVSYQYGFDEPSGNFQNDNQGRGGQGNDFVYADAQDGSSTDNADFTTPADGQKPRMQMYLWSGGTGFIINSPSAIAGKMTAIEGAVSTNNLLEDVGPVTGDIVLYNDDASGTTHLGCGAAANAGSLAGKIAMIDRGDCAFAVKIKNAQNAGAIAVIVVNNSSDNTRIIMSGDDNTITIPAVFIFQSDGNNIKSALAGNTVNATLSANGIQLDGDMDNGIMAHEYTHGISTRLTGGPSSAACLTNDEQGGEGWSDYMALMMTTNWATASISDGPNPRPMGTYVLGEAPTDAGIRIYPYSTDMSINPWTYDQMAASGGEVHDIGEIWAATLWDMTWNIIRMDGINTNLYNADGSGGNSVALKLVMLGLKLQPCKPGYLDARDAILKADTVLYNGRYSCAIWDAFARRGMGVLAQQGSSDNTADQVADFSIPASAVIQKSVDKSEAGQNEVLIYTLKVNSQCAPISGYKIVDTLLSNVTYVSGGTYDPTYRTVTFEVPNQAASQTQTFTFRVRVNLNSYFIPSTLLDEPISANAVPSTLIASTNFSSRKWGASTVNHSASYSLKSTESSGASEQILTSQQSYAITGNTQLSFWQNYNTEAGHDGGVVELSRDNGATWFDAGPYMSQNGYNSTINTNSNLANKRAFSGSSNGFIQTIINLSSFENSSVKFRFRFVTDNTQSGTGWYIDDLLIYTSPAAYNLGQLLDDAGILQSISDTVTTITTQVLPLTWGSFTAEKKMRSALLKWNTLAEINSDKFIIERSNDGIHFYPIATIKASGNTSGSTQYDTEDNAPLPGTNFYRIKEEDRDGKAIYSDVRSVSFGFATKNIFISPNPAGDQINITVAGNNKTLHVYLLNSIGQQISSLVMKDEYMSLPTHNLSSGVYYLKIIETNISSVQKVLIEK